MQQTTGAGPGWYSDPVDDFERRWWDGAQWTEHVSTGRYTGVSPIPPSPLPEEEQILWQGGGATFTTHRAVVPLPNRDPNLAWWMVRDVEVRLKDVVLVIDYPGYTDQRERRIRSIPDADAIGALARTWSRRHRRRVGYL